MKPDFRKIALGGFGTTKIVQPDLDFFPSFHQDEQLKIELWYLQADEAYLEKVITGIEEESVTWHAI